MNNYLLKVSEALGINNKNINTETLLVDLEEWDSMGKISLIIFLDKNYNIQITADHIYKFVTVGDIVKLISSLGE